MLAFLLDEVLAQISLTRDLIFDIPRLFRFYFDLELFQNVVTISHRMKKCCARSNLCDNLEAFSCLPLRLDWFVDQKGTAGILAI